MKILIVDDQQLLLFVVRKAVHKYCPDAEVLCFSDSMKAYEIVEKKEFLPEIAFLDINMPKLNGIDLAKQLISINPKVNIIFVTAHSEFMKEAFAMYVSGYLMKPINDEMVKDALEHLRYPLVQETEIKVDGGIFACTFGNFGLLVNGENVHFSRAKSKELLAYLIDRKGVSITRKELASILFEDSSYSRSEQNKLSIIIHDLQKDLEKVGAQNILLRTQSGYAVDTNIFTADSYMFLKGNQAGKNAYRGEYMEQYEWGEYFKTKFN